MKALFSVRKSDSSIAILSSSDRQLSTDHKYNEDQVTDTEIDSRHPKWLEFENECNTKNDKESIICGLRRLKINSDTLKIIGVYAVLVLLLLLFILLLLSKKL